MGFKSSISDPDVWLKLSTTPDGFEHYSYILIYTDDILILDNAPKRFIDMFQDKYTIKPTSIGEPKTYL